MRYDAYLVTDIDIPWVNDGLRDTPHDRPWFHERLLQQLRARGLDYVLVSGPFEARLAIARNVVQLLLEYGAAGPDGPATLR